MRIRCLVLLLVFAFSAVNAACGQVNYSGKDFFIGLYSYDAYSYGELQLMSKHTASVNFYYYQTGEWQNYLVLPGQPYYIMLEPYEVSAIADFNTETVVNSTLEITSDSNIAVSLLFGEGGTGDDATCVLPCDNQPKVDDYYLVAINNDYPEVNDGMGGFSPFTIVATANVTLRITPSDNTFSHPGGIPFNLNLSKGDKYSIGTPSAFGGTTPVDNDDITGTRVQVLSSSACFPIEVFTSYPDIYIGWPIDSQTVCCADALIEQLLPDSWWDTSFAVVPFINDSLSIIRIFSATDGNTVKINGGMSAVLNAGQHLDTVIYPGSPATITTSSPAAVTQYMVSESESSNVGRTEHRGDPAMLWVYSLSQGLKDTYFKAYFRFDAYGTEGDYLYWITVISEAGNVPDIQLDGSSVAGYFVPFPSDPSLEYAIIPIDRDTGINHHLASPKNIVAYQTYEEGQGSYVYELSDLADAGSDTSLSYKYDTLYKCNGKPVLLTAPSADTYAWSTGATSRSISVSSGGDYVVTALSATTDGCVNRYTGIQQHFFVVNVNDTVTKSDTVNKCTTASALLAGDDASSYTWSNGDTTSSITVSAAGTYSVIEKMAIDSCEQTVMHTYQVNNLQFSPVLLSTDTTICTGDTIVVNTHMQNAVWSNGDTGATLTISKQGVYVAVATDSCGTSVTDSVNISTHLCLNEFCNIEFPNAFTPNNDGRNDVFRAISYGTFSGYTLEVFNRWGECVFTTHNVTEGWDGTYNGASCDMGTYYYYCTVTCPLKKKQIFKGDVSLIR